MNPAPLLLSTVLSLVGAACSPQVVATTGGGGNGSSTSENVTVASSSGPLPPAGTFVLDFTACRSGGLELGGNTNVAFSLNRQEPVRTYAIQDISPQVGPGLVGSDDGYAICPLPAVYLTQPGKLPDHLAAVGTGDLGNVHTVELDVLAPNPEDLSKTYCFAYRDASGTWSADPTVFQRTYDATDGMFHITLAVDKGPIDALYVTTNSGPSGLARLAYTVSP